MTLQQLKYFVEMSHTQHYTRSAEKLNISQPSLSYAISQLSEELGAPLFKTSGKKVHITNIGEAFLPYAESALNIIQQGEAHINQLISPTHGNINLGYIYSVSFDLIPHLIEEFYDAQGNRNVNFNLQVNMTNSLINNLLNGSLDAVIAPLPEATNESICSLPIFNQELFVMVSVDHPLRSKASVKIEELANEKLIMMNKKTDLFIQTDLMFKKHNLFPQTAFVVDECNSMASFVGASLGIGLMPKIPSLDSYKVVAIPIENRIMTRTIKLLWNKDVNPSPALKIFLDHFKANGKVQDIL